ncbi:SRPBCC family protein [Agromyces bauzanensis]
MASPKHTRSIHIDAPVEKVFRFIEDPAQLIAHLPNTDAVVQNVERTPEGVVTGYECKFRELGMHLTADFTREEYEVNTRIVDRSSMGVRLTYSVEPDGTGTTLTAAWDASTLMRMLDAVFFHSDKDTETELVAMKREIESLP